MSVEQKTCAAPQYVPYTGPAVVTARVADHELVLTFTPGLENGRRYRINLGPSISSALGQFVEFRVLLGDVDGDGEVNAADRSAVVGVWAGSGLSCATDFNDDGFTTLSDRGGVVGAWTGTENCAP